MIFMTTYQGHKTKFMSLMS